MKAATPILLAVLPLPPVMLALGAPAAMAWPVYHSCSVVAAGLPLTSKSIRPRAR